MLLQKRPPTVVLHGLAQKKDFVVKDKFPVGEQV